MPSSRTQLTGHARAAGRRSSGALHPRRAATPTGERSQKGRSRPTSSSESAKRSRLRAAAGPGPAGERERAEVVGRAGVEALLGAGGHEPDVAARARCRDMRPAQRGQHAERRRRCRWRPGAPGAESVWAITIRRHVRGVSSMPITLRERPAPGNREALDVHAQPGAGEDPRAM